MKKLISLALSAVLLTSCSVFGKLSEVDYNNQVVEAINATSSTLENTATLYNNGIPSEVQETDSIDTKAMQSEYETALNELTDLDKLQALESRNIEQQNAVRTNLQTYQSAAEIYLETYSKMLTYYGEGEYAKDISKVKSIHETLHTDYTTFMQANNGLVDVLESFVNSK